MNKVSPPVADGLKPCPFCGVSLTPNNNQKDLYVSRYGTHYDHPQDGYCFFSGEEVPPSEIKAWNTRAIPEGVVEPVESKSQVKRLATHMGWTPPGVQTGWQPIETAPKDGKEFIARYPHQGNVMQLVRWCRIHKHWLSKGEWVPGFEAQEPQWHALPPLPAAPEPTA